MEQRDGWIIHLKSILSILLFLFSFSLIIAATYELAKVYRENDVRKPAPQFVLTYAENQADDYPTSMGAKKFAELVEEQTEGRIRIQVFTEAELGPEPSVLEQMQFGGIDFARVSLSPLADVVPQINFLQMPFLYENKEHMWRILEGEIGEKTLKIAFATAAYEPLSWYDGGARNFYTTRPITCLEDMKGMRIRIQKSKMMADFIQLLGAQAIHTEFAEVYSSIERGEIDGAENSLPAYESQKHYEVAPFYIVDEHARIPELQLVSKVTWSKLAPEDQEVIRACAKESALYERELWKEREIIAEQHVREAGCELIEISPEERKRFQQAVQPLYDKYCYEYRNVLEQIQELGNDSGKE